jgi:hypothetical protein
MENNSLRKPDVSRYNNADHVEFHKTSHQICYSHASVIDSPDLITDYHGKVTQEEQSFKWLNRSEFTRKKAETDHTRDRLYSGIQGLVQANLKHFDPSIRDNAQHVNNLLENYGNLTHAGYDAETAGIESLVTRLQSSEYSAAAQNLGLVPWLNELTAQNNIFKSYVADTEKEEVKKPDITPRNIRRETDEALRKITNRVTSLINLNGPAAYAAFAEEFNVHVSHYNTLVHEHYGRLHAKTDITPATVAAIREQPFTNRPVYVIPAVTLRKVEKDGAETVVELKFSEDFTVAYKNNVGPGTATLIITGIGKYKGEIVTTFNIVTAA